MHVRSRSVMRAGARLRKRVPRAAQAVKPDQSRRAPEASRADRRAPGNDAPHQTDDSDRAVYSCQCGFVFEAEVSTTVRCPHCGQQLAW
jgi:rubrerythrin